MGEGGPSREVLSFYFFFLFHSVCAESPYRLRGALPMAAPTPPVHNATCVSVCIKNGCHKMEMEGFKFTETVLIFIIRLMEMCVRLRSGSGRGGEGKSREGHRG